MGLIITFIATIVFCLLLAKPIQKVPWIFYILAVVVATLGVYFTWNQNPNAIVRALAFEIQKGHIGIAAFTLVMFTGVFDQKSTIRRFLNPIRAQLSIIASILIAGHFVPYLKNYVDSLSSLFAFPLNIIVSFLIAIVIFVLLLLLFVTSFDFVKNRMKGKSWKQIQWFAYPFFILVYLHLTLYLLGPAMSGVTNALVNWVFYTVIFAAYLVLRLIKYARDRKQVQV